jgi:hypothetical protein
MRPSTLAATLLLLSAPPATAGEATGLLFLSAEAPPGGGYGGIGWMAAPLGLDRSGPVLSVEAGRSLAGRWGMSAMAGWRLSRGRVTATVLGGAEVGGSARPKASADVWWDDAGWMATARAQATPDYLSWRAAAGLRPAEGMPWIGPELSSTGGGLRLGAHATGVALPGGFEARVSAGWSAGGAYGELSLWRRF